jgi:predicted nuclease of predicted toxin-antitoxin system
VIVTKDADFSDRLMLDLSPPKVVHLRFGNMRKSVFHSFLARIWTQVEEISRRSQTNQCLLGSD